MREALGGRLKWIVTGSAPIPIRTLEELKIMFSVNIING